MDGCDVVVKGFPRSMSQVKIKLFLKQRVQCDATVKKAEDGTVGIAFNDVVELQKYLDADLQSVTWGSETFNLERVDFESNTKIDEGNHLRMPTPLQDNSGSTQHQATPESMQRPPVPLPRQKSQTSNPEQGPNPVLHASSPIHRPPSRHQTQFDSRFQEENLMDGDLWRKKLHVTNIPPHLYSYPAFRHHFARFGMLYKCYMEARKRFAYVTYYEHDHAVQARFNGSHAGPDAYLKISWAENEDQQEAPSFPRSRYPKEHFGSHPHGFPHDNTQGYDPRDRRPMSGAYRNPPRNYPRGRGRGGPRNRPPRPMSCTDIPYGSQSYENPERVRPSRDYGRHHGEFYIGEEPQPLMSIPTEGLATPPQPEIGTGKKKQRKKAKNKVQPEVADGKYTGRKNSMALATYENVHIWEDLKELCPPGRSKCILTPNIDGIDEQTVRMHFESKKRSGGGPVKNIIRMSDGLLVIFQDENGMRFNKHSSLHRFMDDIQQAKYVQFF